VKDRFVGRPHRDAGPPGDLAGHDNVKQSGALLVG
jgi:hypothetical protein